MPKNLVVYKKNAYICNQLLLISIDTNAYE